MKRYSVTCADGISLFHSTDDLEAAGRAYLEMPGACDIYDRQERRYIDPESEIDHVASMWEDWWWSQRVWWARALHKLGLNDPRFVNWTVGTKLGPEPRWRWILRLLGVVGT